MNHKTANLDFFLYSCMESERTLASYSPARQKELRYDEVAEFQRGENVPEAIAEQELDALIDGAFDYHKAECPEITDDDPVYLKDLHVLSPQVVYLLKDIQAAIEAKTGHRVPPYKSEGNGQDQEEVWQHIDRRIEDTFGTYKKEFVKGYFHWSFSDWEEEKVELGDRPPVGRYMPYAFRRNMRDSRGGGRGGPGRGGRDGGRGRDDRGGRGGRDGGRGRDSGRDGGRGRDDRGGRGNGRDGGRDGGRGRFNGRDGGRDGGRGRRDRNGGQDGHSKAEIDQCTQQVQDAVDQLKANGNLDQVQLPPTNSYFRRLQHKQIKEHGFESASTGEGNGRAVVIKRI